MYTIEQLELIKKAGEGFYECHCDCSLIYSCDRNKIAPATNEGIQLKKINALRKCNKYISEDK